MLQGGCCTESSLSLGCSRSEPCDLVSSELGEKRLRGRGPKRTTEFRDMIKSGMWSLCRHWFKQTRGRETFPVREPTVACVLRGLVLTVSGRHSDMLLVVCF